MGKHKEEPGQQKWYSQFALLMWKNTLLRKRHYVLTIFEVLLPAALFMLLVLIRVLPDSVFLPTYVEETSVFKVTNEETLREIFCDESHGVTYEVTGCYYPPLQFTGDRKFIYGPPNTFTNELFSKFADDLNIRIEDIMNVSSLEEMDSTVDTLYLQSEESFSSFYVGVFFDLEDPDSDIPPKDLKYYLRMQKYWFTDLVFPYLQIPGPRNFTGYFPNVASYAAGGFTLLQTLIDRHYSAIVAEDPNITRQFDLQTQMYPYPPYVQDSGMSQFYGSALPTFVVLSLVLLSPTLIKSIVHEKETGVKELVLLMGMKSKLIWIGWFFHSFGVILIIVAIMVFFLKVKVYAQNVEAWLPPILIYSDGFLLFIILLMYGISSIAFCFAISCFFSKPTLATTVGILLWLLSYYIPRGIMDYRYDSMGLAPKVISCLLPNMAVTWVFRIMAMFEGRALGIHWDNLWQTGNPRDELTIGLIMVMLVVDTVLFFLLTWYVDKVMPGTYGVPLKWNFPFKKSYWMPEKNKNSKASTDANHAIPDDQRPNFEPEPKCQNPGIVIKNLRKEFPALGGGVKVAVEDVTLNCYQGQCTVLLGHNGAGKTTTMSVLTGIYPATSGSAEVMGYNISSHLTQARSYVGLCPQHNTLFADLTVQEHLLFFGQLKGASKKDTKEEGEELMEALQLTEKKDQFGNQLSGGMKRKLCLSIALIGGSKVVILDEPSSGLDPESRRWVWSTIQRERSKRTVLVTTHHMEEADVLGDRIAIMAAGRVVCTGSTLFLKTRFGDGYSLRVLPKKDCHIPLLSSTVKAIVPESALVSATQEELVYSLSSDKSRFAPLLEELTVKKLLLKINHVGLSLTSMEQIFLKVGEHFDPAMAAEVRKGMDDPSNDHTLSTPDDTRVSNDHAVKMSTSQNKLIIKNRLTGNALKWERLKSLWWKRILYTKRKWVLLVTQGAVPVLTTLMCIAVDLLFFGEATIQPACKLDLTMFESSVSYVQSDPITVDLAHSYTNQFFDDYKVFNTSNVTESLIDVGINDEFNYREKYITSAVFEPVNDDSSVIGTRMMYQSIPYHAAGVGASLVSNAVLDWVTRPLDSNYSITTYNYPLPYDQRYRLEEDQSSGTAVIYALTMPLALSFLSASYLVFPLQERESKAKQIQIMTGTSSAALWFTSFTWDIITYNVSALLVFVLFVAIDPHDNFTLPGGPGSLFLLLFLYGWGSIPMSYLFSFAFTTSASGFGILTLLNIVTGMIIPVAVWGLNSSEQPGLMVFSDVLNYIFSLIPSYPVCKAFKNFLDTSSYNTQCDIIDPAYQDDLCSVITSHPHTSSPYLPCCPECPDTIHCFKPVSYFRFEEPGMGEQFLWLFIDGIFYLFIIMLLELGVGDRIRESYWKLYHSIFKTKSVALYKVPEDDDVVEEAQLANKLMESPESDTALVVKNLSKVFRNVGLRAVDNLSFTVKRGECFGLLGVNGAGKTTTFRMLTGDEMPNNGDARIGSKFLSKGKRHFLTEIGYCPQFDAILDELTGEETLNLLAGLRGVPHVQRKSMMEDFIEMVDLTECYKRQTRTYSGGNKRKLSTAMALVGSPSLVFLDEPTTGVDPASRRRVWLAIKAARANGQSIILTSHSMDECEALCGKIVILVKGQLRCAGSPGHLKSKFSQGYNLQVKLRPVDQSSSNTELFDKSVNRLKGAIVERLAGAKLTDHHRGMLNYLVPPTISWSELFQVMEELKEMDDTEMEVEDYAATEPSLEHVFLAFAREADLGKPGGDAIVLTTQL